MLKTFRIGGIHPAENKLSAGSAIQELAIPDKISIPLSQHIGAPASAVVAKGDTIKVGQLIGKSTGFVSANIHSSVSGTVVKIDNILDASGFKKQAVIIKVEGDQWIETIDKSPELVRDITLSQQEIVQRINDCGIVGLGGATFPAHVKLSVPAGKTCDVLIINAVECEPYLTADDRMMIEKADECLVGISILMKALNVTRAVVGIENNKPLAISNMSKLSSSYPGIEICPLKTQYPQGGEKQLIAATINREIPSGALPIEVGAVVQNIGTAFAVYEAVQKNKPLIDRVVTLTGKPLAKASNWKFRIGTPVSFLIDNAGGMPDNVSKIIGGGPMMGKALMNIDVPMTKGSSGILLMADEESKRAPMNNCIRCAKCVSVCPMGLEPHLLMMLSLKQDFERLENEAVMDCIECGSCSFTCPSTRPLLDYIRFGKSNVGKLMRARK